MRPIAITGSGGLCRETAPPERREAEGGDWFCPEDFLGTRGFRYYTPSTRYLLAAAKIAVEEGGGDTDSWAPEERGVITGSNYSDYGVRKGFDELILAEGGAKNLSPLEAPNSSVNIPASTVSIKYACKAFSITLTNPMVAGMEALAFGARAIACGRSKWVAAGASEGDIPSGLDDLLGCGQGSGGAAVLILEEAEQAVLSGKRILGRITGSVNRFFPKLPANDWGPELRSEFERLPWPTAGAIRISLPSHACPWNRTVREALVAFLESQGKAWETCLTFADPGQHAALSPVLRVQALLRTGSSGLAVATSPFGHLSMILIEA
jgi:3-oxoacyl-[acyl-carrier-protein] synthase II